MPAFGENLRREREMRGVSLEEIASATKISMRFFEAIEREDFSKLPGGIFSRSFVRSYARYLGLDEDRVMADYQLAAHPQEEFDLHRMPGGSSRSGRQSARTPLIGTLVAGVLLVAGYLLYRYAPRTSEIPPPPPTAVEMPKSAPPPAVPAPTTSGGVATVPGVNPAAGGVTPGAAPNATPGTAPGATLNPQGQSAGVNAAPPGPLMGNPSATKLAGDNDLVLQVAASDPAWVAVDADGKTVLQRVLKPDEVETLKAHKSFDVTTGNAQGVILTLNGETLKPLGRRGEVKSIHLTRDDLKNPAP
ncbi:MAG: RodZ domain-containing protein [Terriglobia bacterium]